MEPALVSRRTGSVVLAVTAAMAVASLIIVLAETPQGWPVSSDPGSPVIPLWVVLLPPAVGIVLSLLLPLRVPRLPVIAVDRRRLLATTTALIAIALAFPVVATYASSEVYALAKVLLFLLVPGVVVLWGRDAVRIEAPRAAWRWWAPLIVVAVWTVLSQVAPWNPSADFGDVDPVLLIVVATSTAITAGVFEELFYRRWLQSRLEAVFGPWPGIALASLLFGLMHVGTHGSGSAMLDAAQVIIAQGSFGLFMGVLWWRYRNLLMNIAAHIIVNGWAVLVHFVTG